LRIIIDVVCVYPSNFIMQAYFWPFFFSHLCIKNKRIMKLQAQLRWEFFETNRYILSLCTSLSMSFYPSL
jgi:hypothetical protein